MQKTIERYRKYAKGVLGNNSKYFEQDMQQWMYEAGQIVKKLEFLELSKRKLLGETLESCSLEELQHLESQLERSLTNIRGRKYQIFSEQIEQLKEKESLLAQENAVLRDKCELHKHKQSAIQFQIIQSEQSNQHSEVETAFHWKTR